MSDDILEALTRVVAVATLPVGILAGIFLGGEVAAVVFVVGWLLLVPVLGILGVHVDLGSETETDVDRSAVTTGDDADDALQRLRERYAAGEIDEVEFERRLEALLETEDVDLPPGSGRRPESTGIDDEAVATGGAPDAEPSSHEPDAERENTEREARTADGEREPEPE